MPMLLLLPALAAVAAAAISDELGDEVKPPPWEVNISDDAFDKVDSHTWVGRVYVDFEDRSIVGYRQLRSQMRNPGRFTWVFYIGRWAGSDVADWFKNRVNELERVRPLVLSSEEEPSRTEEDLQERLVEGLQEALWNKISVVQDPAEALHELAKAQDSRHVLELVRTQGTSLFDRNLGGVRLVGDLDDRVFAICEWVEEECKDRIGVKLTLPLPTEDVEVLRLMGEPSAGFDVIFEEGAEPDEVRAAVRDYGLKHVVRSDGTVAYRWLLG